jgi:hypothetical protein
MRLDAERDILKITLKKSNFSSIDLALKFIRETKKQMKLDAMTQKERDEAEAKRVKDAAAKAARAALAESTEAQEISDEDFKSKVSEFIPSKQAAKIDAAIGNIPNPIQQMYLQSKNTISAEITKLTKADSKKVMAAVAKIVEAQALAFDAMMKDKPQYHRIAQAQHTKAAKALKEKTKKLTLDNLVTPDGSMTKNEYKLLLSCLHPDRECSPNRKAKAFVICKRVCG